MSHHNDESGPPPRRRIGASALIRDEGGDVLLVEDAFRSGAARWGLPGGYVREDEDAAVACRRGVRLQTGLELPPGALLVAHRMPRTGDVAERYDLVFDGGVVPPRTEVQVSSPELSGHWWAPPAQLHQVVPHVEHRVRTALSALSLRHPAYLDGTPALA